ncbi:MAG: chaperone NapD [Nitrospirae bacterium]|nr:chaperone NapD [Nitrospirota bacterium]
MISSMVVSGLLINILLERSEDVRKGLSTIKGLKIHDVIDGYKIVAVVESKTVGDEVTISQKIGKIDGVVGVNLVYRHFDEDEARDT